MLYLISIEVRKSPKSGHYSKIIQRSSTEKWAGNETSAELPLMSDIMHDCQRFA